MFKLRYELNVLTVKEGRSLSPFFSGVILLPIINSALFLRGVMSLAKEDPKMLSASLLIESNSLRSLLISSQSFYSCNIGR